MRRSSPASLGLAFLFAGCGRAGAGDDTAAETASTTGSTTAADP